MNKRLYNITVYRADDPTDKNYLSITPGYEMDRFELEEYLKQNLQIFLTENFRIRNLAVLRNTHALSPPKTIEDIEHKSFAIKAIQVGSKQAAS